MTIRITIDDYKSNSSSYKKDYNKNYKSKYKRVKYKKKKKMSAAFGFDKMLNQMVPK